MSYAAAVLCRCFLLFPEDNPMEFIAAKTRREKNPNPNF